MDRKVTYSFYIFQQVNTLKAIANISGQVPLKKQYLLGTIIDATQSYVVKSGYDYLTKLKIVDQSFNAKTQQEVKNYVHVFIFSKEKSDQPQVYQIGDIIYLTRYEVSLYNNEVKAKSDFLVKSHYRIFSQNNLKVVSANTEKDISGDKVLIDQVKALQQWNNEFFSTLSLTKMSWFGSNKVEIYRVAQSDFDLILRITKIAKSENNTESIYTLTDSKKTTFTIQYPTSAKLTNNAIVKLRSVKSLTSELHVNKNDYTSILLIPAKFYDNANFNKIEYKIVKDSDPVVDLKDYYNHDKKNVVSLVNKSHAKLAVENIKKLSKTGKSDKVTKIQGYILQFEHENLCDALQYICYNNGVWYQAPFSFEEQVLCGVKPKLAFLTSFLVKDASVDYENTTQRTYVFGFDGNGKINLDTLNASNYEQFNKEYKQVCESLVANTNIDFTAELVLQPLSHKNNQIYRVVDTVFKGI